MLQESPHSTTAQQVAADRDRSGRPSCPAWAKSASHRHRLSGKLPPKSSSQRCGQQLLQRDHAIWRAHAVPRMMLRCRCENVLFALPAGRHLRFPPPLKKATPAGPTMRCCVWRWCNKRVSCRYESRKIHGTGDDQSSIDLRQTNAVSEASSGLGRSSFMPISQAPL